MTSTAVRSCLLVYLLSLATAISSTASPRHLHPEAGSVLVPPAPLDSKWNQSLDGVLGVMDTAASNFHTVEASFVWQQYTKIVDEITDTQKGKIYFRRSGDNIEFAADVTQPPDSPKFVLVSGGRIQLYEQRINRVEIYTEGNNRETYESFLLLGFGAGGHDLVKSFDVTYLGPKELDGVPTGELQLIPKSQKVRNNFDRFLLWIDSKGISIQQQVFSGGDYRLNQYSGIQLNRKLSDGVFRLKTNSKTEFISH